MSKACDKRQNDGSGSEPRPDDGKVVRQGLAGRRIGPYRITGELGRGGMGVVYCAEDTALARKVAIKILPAHLGHDDEFIKRFIREARAAAKLDHPGIVQVYQAGRMVSETGDGPCFIAMQHVDGEPLSELIRREGRLNPDRALDLTRQVAEALGAAHAAGLVHRDIKSSNILVTADWRVKVTDFGLATSIGTDRNRITDTGAYLGTPEYSSPEQCEGRELDGRSDLYSLGVVLYELLTGHVPFEAKTPYKLFERIVHETPEPVSRAVPGLPRELLAMLDRMMAKDRNKRYANAEELLSALRRVRAVLTTARRAAGTGRRGSVRRKAARRHTAIVAAICSLLLAFAAWAAWMTGTKDNPPSPEAISPPGPVTHPTVPSTHEPSVAIFDLDDLARKQDFAWLGHGVPSLLISKMSSCPGLVVFSREHTRAALRDAQDNRTEAARKLGARLMVSGSFVASADALQIDLQVIDVETGKLLGEAVSVRGSVEEVLTVADRLGTELRGRFDLLLAKLLHRDAQLAMKFRSAEECLFLVSAEAEVLEVAGAPARDGRGDTAAERRKSAPTGAGDASPMTAGGAGYAPALASRPEHTDREEALKRAGGGSALPPPPPAAAPASKAPVEGGKLAGEAAGGTNRAFEAKAGLLFKGTETNGSTTGGQADKVEPQRYSAAEGEVRAADPRTLALRYRFEGQKLLEEAEGRSDYAAALAKLINSGSLVPAQAGIEELIEKAKKGLSEAATTQ
jgi:serine/threonine protein kinase